MRSLQHFKVRALLILHVEAIHFPPSLDLRRRTRFDYVDDYVEPFIEL